MVYINNQHSMKIIYDQIVILKLLHLDFDYLF